MKIAVFVGSLRKESFNRQLALALADLGSDLAEFVIVPLDDVPMFNQDLEDDVPEPVKRIRRSVAEADGVLLVTPEYNRSIPPVLMNALDWCSRPSGKGVWPRKPAALAGVSIGHVGTAVAQSHLRSVMTTVGMCVMGQPELYVTWQEGFLDDAGRVADEDTRAVMRKFLTRFSEWVMCHACGK